MNEANELQKRKQVEGLVKFGGFSLSAFVIAPFVFMAIKGAVGLLAVAGVGLVAINFVPFLATYLSTMSLKATIFQAKQNPIETLELDYVKKEKSLCDYRDNINSFSASVKNYEDKYKKFKEEYPEDAEKLEDQLNKMKKLLELRRKRYSEAKVSLDKYSSEIDRAKAVYEMAQEAQKMKNMAGVGAEDFMDKIKTETSIDAVESSMNQAFAELETSLIEEDDEKKLSNHKFPETAKTK